MKKYPHGKTEPGMTEDTVKTDIDICDETPQKYDNDWKLELLGLFGFCVSGAIFILSGIKNGDHLTIAGSCVWIFSCLIWMIPYMKKIKI